MRLWSISPEYLDSKGLVALWRESLLAKNVLLGKTIGYKNHPQLIRFKKLKDPVNGINYYLSTIYQESIERGYHFNKALINWDFKEISMDVTRGQLKFEFEHLLKKLRTRDNKRFINLSEETFISPNQIFNVVSGDIESWEIV